MYKSKHVESFHIVGVAQSGVGLVYYALWSLSGRLVPPRFQSLPSPSKHHVLRLDSLHTDFVRQRRQCGRGAQRRGESHARRRADSKKAPEQRLLQPGVAASAAVAEETSGASGAAVRGALGLRGSAQAVVIFVKSTL